MIGALFGMAPSLVGLPLDGGPLGAVGVGSNRAEAASPASRLVPVGPIRLADTRGATCDCEQINPNRIRVAVAGRDGIAEDITAAAVTITATDVSQTGYVTAYPSLTDVPTTSTLNLKNLDDVANSAIIPVGSDGAIELDATMAIGSGAELIVDVTAVFEPSGPSRAGRFVAVEPERLVDTRSFGQQTLPPGGTLDVALPPGVDSDATALAINVTSDGAPQAGYVSVFATGDDVPFTSMLNPNGSGRPVAGSIIAPANSAGITLRSDAGGDLIVDIVGWFTGSSAAPSNEGLFVTVAPDRLVDTRQLPVPVFAGGTIEVDPEVDASAIVTNLTIDRSRSNGFVTGVPAGRPLPEVSSVNAVSEWDTVANFAITPISTRGAAYYSERGTDLIVDITGYFQGDPMAATQPPAPNRGLSKGLLVGDSTMLAIPSYRTQYGLQGFTPQVEAESCRALNQPSCGRSYRPPNSVSKINEQTHIFDSVVIMAGYDEWYTTFESSFNAVVQAARDTGARRVIWLSYKDDVPYLLPNGVPARESLIQMNNKLGQLVASGAYPDVIIADWNSYTASVGDWISPDGIHLRPTGALGLADYISRYIAHLEGRSCPQPWEVGGSTAGVCPNPDEHGPPADVVTLYS